MDPVTHPLYICLKCKKIFKSYQKKTNPKYCTIKCYSEREVSDETRKRQSEARKGKTPWNKGVNMWEGKQHPRGTKGRKFPERSGKNCHFWKGGVTQKNMVIRKSLEYRIWREKVFERDNYTCVFCKKRGGKLNADHIKPFSEYYELRFEIGNGRTLCIECHVKTPTFGSKSIVKKLINHLQ